ncbi:glucose-6-phosphate 3-dehydrogenase [Mesoterricola silvestris]|uniref:Glucose-6-phosphate 3-dehydrogenase n=2 Tax=Mesoterricola silvestris TaxID=2927979 RepID=A0AA48K8Y5_9BACT|nr:glucose-6-phosphate 3-dehydrogenase [Mesoterricola silvestris]
MHATALARVHGPGICGVYDCNPSQAVAFADRHHCQPYVTAERLLEDVEAVIVASPNAFHVTHVTQAIGQGCHVLCEKPLVTRLEDAFRLVDSLAGTRQVAAVGFNYRYLPIAKMIKHCLSNGAFGRVLAVRMALKKRSAFTKKTFTWRDGEQTLGTSGAMGDLGVHLIDLFHFCFEDALDPDSISAKLTTHVASRENQPVRVDDDAFTCLRSAKGCFVSLAASKTAEPNDLGLHVEVVGENLELRYASMHKSLYQVKEQADWEWRELPTVQDLFDPPEEVFGWADSFTGQAWQWLDLIQGSPNGELRTLASFKDGLQAQRILEGILQKTGAAHRVFLSRLE